MTILQPHENELHSLLCASGSNSNRTYCIHNHAFQIDTNSYHSRNYSQEMVVYNHQAGHCRRKSSPSPENCSMLKHTLLLVIQAERERVWTNKMCIYLVTWQSAHITLRLCLLNLQGDMGTLPCKHKVHNPGGVCKVHEAVLWQLIKFLHYITTMG